MSKKTPTPNEADAMAQSIMTMVGISTMMASYTAFGIIAEKCKDEKLKKVAEGAKSMIGSAFRVFGIAEPNGKAKKPKAAVDTKPKKGDK